ncbi:hypothetical protein [Xylophilus sp.]|uniref:hypothetical protein n=1 Tax=Xylophilus sp. TaxID=2653893 RepID=UPI0013B61D53|nr:hypothetical protein [Xylophilus sp.]KAF1047066.1 MAG: hypothetical protein GAK38_02110 [Xylophilus sp.]
MTSHALHWLRAARLAAALAGAALLCTGCAVVAVADAAVTVGAVAVKTTAKAAGAVVGAVIPD